MKPLRYILVTASIAIGIFSFVLYTGCNKSKCGSTTCQNGGSCSGSTCICPTGYSGASCQTGWSDVFIGTYNCSRNSCSPAVTGDTAWVSAITRGADGATISISNFDNSGKTVSATVDTFQHIQISSAPPSYGVDANGSYSSGKITMSFTTSAGGGITGYSCKMLMTKQ